MNKLTYCRLLLGASVSVCPSLVLAQGQQSPPLSPGDPASAADPAASAAGNSPAETPRGIEEIVVTANKRRETAQRVPIAISSITAATLGQAGISSTVDLGQKVPGLNMQASFNGLQPHLRGVGTTTISSGNESSVATYVDGVYIAAMSGGMLQLADIAQVDVLKGPQGTLFGRNATGGVIEVRTKDPTQDFHLDASATYGNYNTGSGTLYVSGGLTDKVAADFSAYGLTQGRGYGKNQVTGHDVYRTKGEYALRSKLLIKPDDRTTIKIAGDASRTNNNGPATFSIVPGHPANTPGGVFFQPGGNHWDLYNNYDPRYVFRQNGVSLQVEHEFDFAKLTSISAYRTSHKNTSYGEFPPPSPQIEVAWTDKGNQVSQEFQLGSLPSSRITWLVGLYYLHAKIGYHPFTLTGPGQAPLQTILFQDNQTTDAGAAFGQATVPLFDRTNLTVGLRYSIERRGITGFTGLEFPPALANLNSIVGVTDAHKTFRKLTWRLSLDHRFADNVMGYISYNRGFKSGVYPTLPPGGPGAEPVRPEVLDAYEVGLKTDLFNRRLRFNVSGFLYEYKDLQVNIFRANSALLENGAKARIYGVDVDLVAKPTDRLTVSASAEILHDRFTKFPDGSVAMPVPASQGGGNLATSGDLSGNQLPYTAKRTFDIGADYRLPVLGGNLTVSGNYSYNSGWFAGAENFLKQKSYSVVNAQLTYAPAGGRFEISGWARNLTNKTYATYFIFFTNPFGSDVQTLAPPRTYGLTLRVKI